MPNNNYNYGASYIMGADKTKVTEHPETNLTREKKDFTTPAKTDVSVLISLFSSASIVGWTRITIRSSYYQIIFFLPFSSI